MQISFAQLAESSWREWRGIHAMEIEGQNALLDAKEIWRTHRTICARLDDGKKHNCAARMNAVTTEPIAAPINVSATPMLAEFGRWQDVQRLFGIKRGTLYNLLAEGKVKSVSMRRKGNKHGCRLFYLPGISEFLHSMLEAQSAPR